MIVELVSAIYKLLWTLAFTRNTIISTSARIYQHRALFDFCVIMLRKPALTLSLTTIHESVL